MIDNEAVEHRVGDTFSCPYDRGRHRGRIYEVTTLRKWGYNSHKMWVDGEDTDRIGWTYGPASLDFFDWQFLAEDGLALGDGLW